MSGSTRTPNASGTQVAVWDIAQRVGHWVLVGSFATAWLLSEGERWRQWHVVAGLVALGVAVWRLAWGFWGSRHARFADFVRGPTAVAGYLRSLLGTPAHHLGHNPAGGWAIVLLLTLTVATATTGWLGQNELTPWAETLHEPLAQAWMLTVVVHVTGVLVSSWLHAENLLAAMWHGRKPARTDVAPAENLDASTPSPTGRRLNLVGLLSLWGFVALSLWLGLVGLPRWLGLE